ncbi:MAG: hypothetical protein K2H64_12765 [Desulfovibrio sp.]|nr:hypothetical protein [Desulfovibrio sp.]
MTNSQKNEASALREYEKPNKFLKDIVDLAAKEDPDILPADSDSEFLDNHADELTLQLIVDTKPHTPDLTLWYSGVSAGGWTEARRYDVTATRYKHLAKVFLEGEDYIYPIAPVGRGEDALFSFGFDFTDVNIDNPCELADIVARLYKKTKEFAILLKNNPNISIGDLRPLPKEAPAFEGFCHDLYSVLAKGAIRGLAPLPAPPGKCAWENDEYTLEMTIPLKGDVFLLNLSCFYLSGIFAWLSTSIDMEHP